MCSANDCSGQNFTIPKPGVSPWSPMSCRHLDCSLVFYQTQLAGSWTGSGAPNSNWCQHDKSCIPFWTLHLSLMFIILIHVNIRVLKSSNQMINWWLDKCISAQCGVNSAIKRCEMLICAMSWIILKTLKVTKHKRTSVI